MLLSQRNLAEARAEAQAAAALADTDEERSRAKQLLELITRAEGVKQ